VFDCFTFNGQQSPKGGSSGRRKPAWAAQPDRHGKPNPIRCWGRRLKAELEPNQTGRFCFAAAVLGAREGFWRCPVSVSTAVWFMPPPYANPHLRPRSARARTAIRSGCGGLEPPSRWLRLLQAVSGNATTPPAWPRAMTPQPVPLAIGDPQRRTSSTRQASARTTRGSQRPRQVLEKSTGDRADRPSSLPKTHHQQYLGEAWQPPLMSRPAAKCGSRLFQAQVPSCWRRGSGAVRTCRVQPGCCAALYTDPL